MQDELLQIRLYSTEEDELDCEAWKVLAWLANSYI